MSRRKSPPRATFTSVILVLISILLSACSEPKTFAERNANAMNPSGSLTPSMEAGKDYVSNYWSTPSTLATSEQASATNPMVMRQQLSAASNGNVFLNWTTTASGSGETLKIMRGTPDAMGMYSWSDPTNSMFSPAGITADATGTQFTVNKNMADGYALWSAGGKIKISEFMGSMGHFMTTAELADAHAPTILVDSAGNASLVVQEHMTGGFSLNVSMRMAVGNWMSGAALHRMGMNGSEITMPNHFLTTIVDGQNNLRSVWLEKEMSTTRLMTATYTSSTKTWGTPVTIIDSTNTDGVDLSALKSMSAVGESSSSNLRVVLFQDTGGEKAVFTIDFISNAWRMAMRRDAQTAARTIAGEPVYAVGGNGQLLATWVESDSGMYSVMALRFEPAAGWHAVEEVAMAPMGSTISDLIVALNSLGHAAVLWFENDSSQKRLMASLQMIGMEWAMKELVASFDVSAMLHVPSAVMLEDGTPWVVLVDHGMSGANTTLTTRLITRGFNINTTGIPSGSGSGSGDGDGHDHGGGDTGGSTGGSTGGGTGGDTGGSTGGGTGGSTGGDTGGSTGGGTGGTGGGTGGDTGGSTGGGTGGSTGGGTGGGSGTSTDAVTGLWGMPMTAHTITKPMASMAAVAMPKIQVTKGGNLFASWMTLSDPDATTSEVTVRDLTITRGVMSASGAYTWSSAADTMLRPVGFTTAATDIDFVANPTTADGIAVWNYNAKTVTSEFMGAMGHFMSKAELTEGHAPTVLVDANGQAYLLMQEHMTGGFGLSVYKRTAADQWSTTPATLHRMDMTTAINLPNHFLIATMDGQNNLRAIWLEERASVYALRSALYNATSNTWGAVETLDSMGMDLTKLAGAVASGAPGGSSIQVVFDQQNGMDHALFAAAYNGSAWQMAMRIDSLTATQMIMAEPSFATNAAGNILVGWILLDSSMTASNTSGKMNMLAARKFVPGTGWSALEMIAHANMMADASALSVALTATGDASAAWLEGTSTGASLLASQRVAANTSWSQKELVRSFVNADGSIQALTVAVDTKQVPLAIYAIRTTNGTTDTINVVRVPRATAIGDAQTGGGTTPTPDPTPTPTPDPTPTPTPDPGTTPESVNWTTPLMAVQMMHTSTSSRFYGPQVVLDDLDAAVIRMSMANVSSSGGTRTSVVDNQAVRRDGAGDWMDILAGSDLFAGLSTSAVLEQFRAIPTTGNIYGLIRDSDKLYLARYMPESGWAKLEVPGISASISRKNLHLVTNLSGMVTVTWHQPASTCCKTDIMAKHFMIDTGWAATQKITVPAHHVVMPHAVDAQGNVHVAWLESSATNANKFDVKLATYTPMTGWSAITKGPTELATASVVNTAVGDERIIVVTDVSTSTVDAYAMKHAGGWTKFANINQKVSTDGTKILRSSDTRIVANGDQVMVAWRESATSGTVTEVRYRTAAGHHMVDSGGMDMWHWDAPSQIGGMNAESESDLNYALDAMGNAYAVWTSVDKTANTSNIYANKAAMGAAWPMMPELLASYDMSTGSYALHSSIAFNALGKIAIVWDQHVASTTMAMHRVWFVENE